VEEDLGGVRPFMDMDLGLEEDRESEGCLKKKMRMRAGKADDSTSTLRALDDVQDLTLTGLCKRVRPQPATWNSYLRTSINQLNLH
jgi:hypothetical protein